MNRSTHVVSDAQHAPTQGRSRSTSRWLYPALLILPPLVLYWPFLFGGKTLYWGTALLQFWPWRRFAVQELLAGRLPLWNPYAGSGVPLLADHQSAILYPLNLLYLLLPVERAMGVSLALHALLAAWAMYALLREWGVSRLGRVVGGLAFSLSGYMVARGSFLTEISALPWLPLLWLYGGRLLAHKKTATCAAAHRPPAALNVVALAGVVAIQFLAGHAQTWFYSLASLAFLALWKTLTRLRRARNPSTSLRSPSFPVSRFPSPQSSALQFLAAVLWGVALSAAQFLPTLELSLLARRAKDAGWDTYALQYSMWPWRLITLLLPDFFGNPARGDYWGYATYWEDAGYVGVLPFVLAVWAVIAWASRRRVRAPSEDVPAPARPCSENAPAPVPGALAFLSLAVNSVAAPLRNAPGLATLALLALLMALGKNTPFYLLFYRYVPGFGAFQAPARWLGVYTAAVAALAGMGVDALVARRARRLVFWCRLGVAGGISAGMFAFIGRAYLPGAMRTFADALLRFAVLWIGAMLALLWGQSRAGVDQPPASRAIGSGPRPASRLPMWVQPWRSGRSGRSGRVGGSLLLLFVAADLVWAGYGLNPASDPALYESQTGIGAALAADGPQGRTFISAQTQHDVLYERYLDFGDYGPRADVAPGTEHWWDLRETLLPDLGMVERLPAANTFEPLIEARTRALLAAVNEMPPDVARRTLGLMHVAYLLDPSPDAGAEVLYRSPTMAAARNPHLLPRAYVVYQARAASSPERALALLSAPDFDPGEQVVLESAPNPPIPVRPAAGSPIPQSPNPATFLPSPPNQVTIRAVLPQPGVLVLADTFYPGWQAAVDGRAVEIYRANYAYRAVILEAGAHEVVFAYQPLSWWVGAWISAASGVGALAAVLIHWKKRVADE